MVKEITTQVQETQSPKQDKPKVKYPKTHINKINQDQTQRTNIKSSQGKTTNNRQGDSCKDNNWSFNRTYLKVMKEKKPTVQITVPSKDLIQI